MKKTLIFIVFIISGCSLFVDSGKFVHQINDAGNDGGDADTDTDTDADGDTDSDTNADTDTDTDTDTDINLDVISDVSVDAGNSCGLLEQCDNPSEFCELFSCELVTRGICTESPEICLERTEENYAPQCGCNNKSYFNECERRQARESLLFDGCCDNDDLDNDGICNEFDCAPENQNCGVDCTDNDGDEYCYDHDCQDDVFACNIDCSSSDGDNIPDCMDICICGTSCPVSAEEVLVTPNCNVLENLISTPVDELFNNYYNNIAFTCGPLNIIENFVPPHFSWSANFNGEDYIVSTCDDTTHNNLFCFDVTGNLEYSETHTSGDAITSIVQTELTEPIQNFIVFTKINTKITQLGTDTGNEKIDLIINPNNNSELICGIDYSITHSEQGTFDFQLHLVNNNLYILYNDGQDFYNNCIQDATATSVNSIYLGMIVYSENDTSSMRCFLAVENSITGASCAPSAESADLLYNNSIQLSSIPSSINNIYIRSASRSLSTINLDFSFIRIHNLCD